MPGLAPSTISVSGAVLGSTEPRLWTRPLRPLTPETSYGFDVAWFADHVLGLPLDPWEEWLVIHGGELLEDGRPRFRRLLVIVARQNGKTHLLVVLTLFWLYVECVPLILGTSTKLGYAKESWTKAKNLAQRNEDLAGEILYVRRAAGEESLVVLPEGEEPPPGADGFRYLIAAANADGGRSLTIWRLVLDELRQHHSWDAYDASYKAMNAVRSAQMWAITNQGDAKSVVLTSLRAEAVEEPGGTERIREDADGGRFGMFEWSAPPGSQADDPRALAMANPNLGRRVELADLIEEARAAMAEGGERLARFLTEILCMRVPVLNPAVDPVAWADCGEPGTMDDVRGRLAAVIDVAPDGRHVALVVAGVLADKRVRVEVAGAWDDTATARAELPGLIAQIKPKKFGWLPIGPAASLNVALRQHGRRRPGSWPPPGVEVEEITQEVPAVCMGFAELVGARQLVHSNDPLLDDHTLNAEKRYQGDRWIFSREGAHVNTTYAAAGAVHLARTMPPGSGRPRLVGPKRQDN